ncbi:MAG: glycosyltransferase [Myxococcota bacterium]
MSPDVSVVVPTYGRPALLRACVQSVLGQQTRHAVEVVVVDDGGTPRARDTLADITDPRLRILEQRNGGPARARNHGLREARAPVVAFIDDDCVAQEGWLEHGVNAFQPDVVMVQGPVAPPRRESLVEWHYIETGNGRHDLSCNFLVRRDVALDLGGFDESFPLPCAEDMDFCWRMERRGRILVEPQARVVHELVRMKWRRRRARPRMWESYFRLYGLHPERIEMAVIPLIGRHARHMDPRARIAISLALMQFVYILKFGRGAAPRAVAEEALAGVLNIGEALTRIPAYAEQYRAGRSGSKGARG